MGNLPAVPHRDLARPETAAPEPQHIVGRILRDTTPAPSCKCGNATDRGHNGFTCADVLAIRAGTFSSRTKRDAR